MSVYQGEYCVVYKPDGEPLVVCADEDEACLYASVELGEFGRVNLAIKTVKFWRNPSGVPLPADRNRP